MGCIRPDADRRLGPMCRARNPTGASKRQNNGSNHSPAMTDRPRPDVAQDARIHVTDWGDFWRVDVNGVGARLGAEPPGGWAGWAQGQNENICDHLAASLARSGGGFDSVAEWTVAVNRHYDLGHMRQTRLARWRDGFRSAITTLPWAHPTAERSVNIQAMGYVPKPGRPPVTLRAWRPRRLYDCEFLGLAPAVVVDTGAARMIYLAGVVAWDQAIQPLAGGDPRAQVRLVLQMIQDVLVEAGGTPADVVRLRPFAASPSVARLIREECDQLWTKRGHPAPVITMAEESSFWDAPGLCTEIQAMGIVGGEGVVVRQESLPSLVPGDAALGIRVTRTPRFDIFHVGEIRTPAGTPPEREAEALGAQVTRIMAALGLTAADICLAFGYVSSAAVLARLPEVLGAILPPAALHLVHSPAMPELAGGSVKLELTARRLK